MFRKSRRLLIFILFAFSLNSAQAGLFNLDLRPFSQSVINWFQTNREKLPIFGIGALVGITTLWLFSQKKSSRLLYGIDPKIIKNTSRTKIAILPQIGNAQCGYHSLKNSILFYDIHSQQQWINETQDSRLIQNDHYQDLLKKWKTKVVQLRKQQVLKDYLQKQLLTYLEKPKSPWFLYGKNVTDIVFVEYKNFLENIAVGHSDLAIEQFSQNSEPYVLTGNEIAKTMYLTKLDEIVDIVIKKLPDNLSISEDALKKQIKDYVKDIRKYIPKLDEIKIEIKPGLIESLFKQSKFNSDPDEWLDGDEIIELLKFEINDSNIRDHFTIVDDINQFKLTSDDVCNAWKNPECFHLFIIGTMSEATKSRGHWFVLAAQKMNNEAHYCVADSLGIDRTNDYRVLQIIQQLEISSKSSSSN